MAHMFLILCHLFSTTLGVTDIFTTWTQGSPSMPGPTRAQATGYDPYTGIIYLLGGTWHNTDYLTYNTITKEMSSFQSLDGSTDSWMAQYYQQIHRTIYMYDNYAQCIDTFDMETLTFTECWAYFPLRPENSNIGCLAIDDTARYFYIIPETNDFFFYDSVEETWYIGPDTVQSAHLFAGCDVFNDKLYYFGGQVCWGQSCAGLRTIEYLDISDMDALKQNPTTFSWNTMTDFLPVTPEADFVRNIQLNNIIYTVTGYRYSGDGTNIDVMGIDLTNNQVDVLTEIPTDAIGGSLVWDSCQMQLYYFGGSSDGASDLSSWYYSNTVSNQYLPAKHRMDCQIPEFITATTTTDIPTTTSIETTIATTSTTADVETTTATTTTSIASHATTEKERDTISTDAHILIKTTLLNEVIPLDVPHNDLATMQLVVIIICIIVVCVTLLFAAYNCGRKSKDDKKASLSELGGRDENIHLHIGVQSNSNPTAPTMDDIKETEDVKHWLENIVGFKQYTNQFLSNGYDTFDIIMDITDAKELEDIGIVLKGHQTRIIKQISGLKKQYWKCPTCNVRNKNDSKQCKSCQYTKEEATTDAVVAEGGQRVDTQEGVEGPGYAVEDQYAELDVLLS